MKLQKCLLFISLVHIMNLFSATCRPVEAPNPHPSALHKILSTKEGKKNEMVVGAEEDERREEENYKEVKKMIGSRPPCCANKCFGCVPCEAIQVPTTSSSVGVGLHSANYLPEGWKCKCGPTFFTP